MYVTNLRGSHPHLLLITKLALHDFSVWTSSIVQIFNVEVPDQLVRYLTAVYSKHLPMCGACCHKTYVLAVCQGLPYLPYRRTVLTCDPNCCVCALASRLQNEYESCVKCTATEPPVQYNRTNVNPNSTTTAHQTQQKIANLLSTVPSAPLSSRSPHALCPYQFPPLQPPSSATTCRMLLQCCWKSGESLAGR